MTSLNELPPHLKGEISDTIQNYSTPIVRYTRGSDGKETVELKGSGTFVTSSGTFAILTAAHVVGELEKKKPFSLGLYVQESEHKYLIDSQYLRPQVVARGKDDATGPDLGLIELPNSELGWIKASRTFYDLDAAEEYIGRPGTFDTERYIYLLCGTPDLLKADLPSERHYVGVRQYTQLCLSVSVGSPFTVGDFNYYDAEVDYGERRRLPESFGGVSGGGLWVVPLTENTEDALEAGRPMLYGVAFYQTAIESDLRKIRCHGPSGIFRQVREGMGRRT
ncbi:MAG: hypothetical protein ABSD38_29570 [Syntrophorhabdales bacterium]|jgi:hypothetical protein